MILLAVKPLNHFLAYPSTSVSLTHTSTTQTNLAHHLPPITNPPLVNPPFLPQLHIMVTWYATLVLPLLLVFLTQDYQSKIPLYDASSSTTTQQHVDKMNDYFERQEIDDETVKLRMFSQSLGGRSNKMVQRLNP